VSYLASSPKIMKSAVALEHVKNHWATKALANSVTVLKREALGGFKGSKGDPKSVPKVVDEVATVTTLQLGVHVDVMHRTAFGRRTEANVNPQGLVRVKNNSADSVGIALTVTGVRMRPIVLNNKSGESLINTGDVLDVNVFLVPVVPAIDTTGVVANGANLQARNSSIRAAGRSDDEHETQNP
jgi:hypothetical protein